MVSIEQRKAFDEELLELRRMLFNMSDIAREMITKSVKSLENKDFELARWVIDKDEDEDILDRRINDFGVRLIALRQPAARDLRSIIAAFKISLNLERIADLAVNIAEVTIDIGDEPLIKPLIDIPRMAEISETMVDDAIRAYMNEDAELAKDVWNRDDIVDKIEEQIFNELLLIMMSNPRTIKQSMKLILVARYLERVADHATNIAEAIIYMVSGEAYRGENQS